MCAQYIQDNYFFELTHFIYMYDYLKSATSLAKYVHENNQIFLLTGRIKFFSGGSWLW